MATWNDLTDEQKIRLLMEQDGLDRTRAKRHVMILDGRLDPHDVVGLQPAQLPGIAARLVKR